MKITIDTTAKSLILDDGSPKTLPLYSREAFEAISEVWLKVGWDQKYTYAFTWLGRPIIQLPEDIVRIQEVIFSVQPDVIIETGVAHGGSLILSASLCKAMGRGRVIGVDIEIRKPNRKAIEEHFLSSYVTLIEGSSVAPEILSQVRSHIKSGEKVLVILDSCHTKAHVAAELEGYHSMVSTGSYLVAMDGVMRVLSDLERGSPDWTWNNPANAAEEFAARHPEFALEQPAWPFNESNLKNNLTYGPSAFLRRLR